MKLNIIKLKFPILTFVFCFFYAGNIIAQNFYPQNFGDMYAVYKTEKGNLIGTINERYLKLKDFSAINDSVFISDNKDEILMFHFNLNHLKFYEVSVDYYLSKPLNVEHFLGQISNKTTKAIRDFAQKQSFYLEEESTNKKMYVSLLAEKDKIYQNQKFNKIKFTFREKLIDDKGNSYKWSKSEHQLSRAYPFQNSVWYFDVKIQTEKKVDTWGSDRITTILFCSKTTKYPHKIEFLDDRNYTITFQNNNEIKTLKGYYKTNDTEIYGNNQLNDIEFDIDQKFADIPKSRNNEAEEIPQKLDEVENLISDSEIGSWDYLYRLFTLSYEISIKANNDITLTHIDLSGGNYPVATP